MAPVKQIKTNNIGTRTPTVKTVEFEEKHSSLPPLPVSSPEEKERAEILKVYFSFY